MNFFDADGLAGEERAEWVAESAIAQEISTILVNHPEYYDEVRAHVGGLFAKPKS